MNRITSASVSHRPQVGAGHRLAPPQRDRAPAGQHPEVAAGVVQRLRQLGVRLHRRQLAAAERRLPDHGQPLGGRVVQRGQSRLGRPGPRQHRVAGLLVGRRAAPSPRPPASRPARPAPRPPGAPAGAAGRSGATVATSRARAQPTTASSQRPKPCAGSRHQGDHDDRLHAGLDDHQLPAPTAAWPATSPARPRR